MKFFVIASLAATLFLGVASIPVDVYEREPNDLQYLSSRATTCVIASLKGAVCDINACVAVGGGCNLNAKTKRCKFNKKMSDNRSEAAPSCRGCDCISGPDASDVPEPNPGSGGTDKSHPQSPHTAGPATGATKA